MSFSSTQDWSGTENIIIEASYPSDNMIDTISVQVTVNEIVDPPLILTTPTESIFEDESYYYQISAFDPDNNIELVYACPTIPAWLYFNSETQELLGTPENSDVGIHFVVMTVTDNLLNTSVQSFDIQVINVNDTPIFNMEDSMNANVLDSFELEIDVIDIDGDYLIYAIENAPEWLEVNGNVITGDVPYSALDNGELDSQSFNFIIFASDEEYTIGQEYTLTVIDSINYDPEIILITDVLNDEGYHLDIVFNSTFFDQESTLISGTYFIQRNDSGDWITLDSISAQLLDSYSYRAQTLYNDNFSEFRIKADIRYNPDNYEFNDYSISVASPGNKIKKKIKNNLNPMAKPLLVNDYSRNSREEILSTWFSAPQSEFSVDNSVILSVVNVITQPFIDFQIPIEVSNVENFTAFQFDLSYPSELTFRDAVILSDRATNHNIEYNIINDNIIRVIAYSSSYSSEFSNFNDNSGDVAYLIFEGDQNGDYAVSLSNVIVSNTNGENILTSFNDGFVTIGWMDCQGIENGPNLIDDCGVCDDNSDNDNISCSGCTDPEAYNYDEDAIIDDDSCDYIMSGDLNQDSIINILDIVILVNIILNDIDNSNADINGDGVSNILDIVILMNMIINN